MNAFFYACIFIMLDNKAIVHCLTEFLNESNNQAATTVNLIVANDIFLYSSLGIKLAHQSCKNLNRRNVFFTTKII